MYDDVTGYWSLRARAWRLFSCQPHGQVSFDRATIVRRWLVLTSVVVTRRSRDTDENFVMFEVFCTSDELL